MPRLPWNMPAEVAIPFRAPRIAIPSPALRHAPMEMRMRSQRCSVFSSHPERGGGHVTP
jgi:hypothetical protein